MSDDYYDILGISKNATKEQIKSAFRKLAHKHHPDKGGNHDEFSKINEAYQTLSDDKKRKAYDTYGQTFGADTGGFDFNNFNFNDTAFDNIFSMFREGGVRRKRGADISIDIEISFAESVYGSKRIININKNVICDNCKGKKVEKGYKLKKCDKCNGLGKINQSRSTIFGQISVTTECKLCSGTGEMPEKECGVCLGEGTKKSKAEINIQIPAGIEDNAVMRAQGKGEEVAGGIAGDLYIKIHIIKNKNWIRRGNALVYQLPIKLTDAMLGAEYDINTPNGEKLKVKIPSKVTDRQLLRLRKKGLAVKEGAFKDVFVELLIQFPNSLSEKAKKLFEQLKGEGV